MQRTVRELGFRRAALPELQLRVLSTDLFPRAEFDVRLAGRRDDGAHRRRDTEPLIAGGAEEHTADPECEERDALVILLVDNVVAAVGSMTLRCGVCRSVVVLDVFVAVSAAILDRIVAVPLIRLVQGVADERLSDGRDQPERREFAVFTEPDDDHAPLGMSSTCGPHQE